MAPIVRRDIMRARKRIAAKDSLIDNCIQDVPQLQCGRVVDCLNLVLSCGIAWYVFGSGYVA